MKFIAFIRRPIVIANILFLIAIIFFFRRFGEFGRLIELLSDLDIKWVLVALILQALTYFCNGAMWTTTLTRFGHKIPHHLVATLSVMKLFIDQMIPSFGMSGDLAIVRRLLGKGVQKGEAATVLIINLFTRYASYVALFEIAVVLLWVGNYLNKSIEILAGVFSIFVIGACCAIFLILRKAHRGHIPLRIVKIRFLRPFLDALTEAHGNEFKYPTLWMKVSILQALVFILDIFTLQVLIIALGHPVNFLYAFITFMLASAVATLSIIPAGIGAFEGTAVAMLVVFGVPFDISVAATLLLRGFAYWIPMIPGGILFWWEMKLPQEK